MKNKDENMESKKEKYKDIDFSGVDRFNKALKVTVIGILIPIFLIIILVFVIAFGIINAYWHIEKRSITEYLSEIYHGKYVIVSEDIDEKENGYYKISFKDNQEIVFNGYHKWPNTNREDSQAHKLKYYFEHLEDYDLKQKFVPKESYYKINEEDEPEFLKYELLISVKNYEGFDETILNCYKMLEYLKDKSIYGYTILINYNNYMSGIGQGDEKLDYSFLLKREKNNYIRYLINNKLSTKEIPSADMQDIYRPEYLTVILNGKTLDKEYQVRYDDGLCEYEVQMLPKFVENIPSVEKLKYSTTGLVNEIKYNNNVYKLHYTSREAKDNSIPYICRISYLQHYFNAEVKYDYNGKIIYINIV